MNEETSKAFTYAERLLSVAIDVVGAAQVQIDGNWARAPKIIGLTPAMPKHIQFSGGAHSRAGKQRARSTYTKSLFVRK
jgi:hypothetical protein